MVPQMGHPNICACMYAYIDIVTNLAKGPDKTQPYSEQQSLSAPSLFRYHFP